ncbi:mandelate racemase/muconate lactonizing enzyme family protein [Acuticoccus kandeliae]|uniref:mandelate racemase/muconate lactonizing enzyme family protein n=1 Tax=Acuticoccus kandeliae TaxID=2073160 RepID=UPI000D3E205C|nr:mandelate racemase/muconate lactonizing enzyme family protein [Acuticoccus kandeliae]
MKVTKIETFKHWVDWCNWMFVRVSTDEGLVGWGEGSLHGALESVETAIAELAPHLIGQDPAGPERHWHRLYHAWRWRGGATMMTALAAIDIALWDLEGKRLGVPVHRLLGGAHRTRLPVYASHWISADMEPDTVKARAAEAVARGFGGFKCIPVRPAELRENEARELARAVDLVAAAREGAGPEAEIYVELSEFLSPRTAPMLDRALAPYRPAWFEEPIPYENPAAMVRLQREIAVPIATGERLLTRHEFAPLVAEGGCRIAQPDVMHAGGLTECRRIAALADMHYVPIAPHNPGGPICTAASMHLAAAVPNFLVLEQMEPQRAARDAASTIPIGFEDGHFILPDGPGLGVEPNLEALAEMPYRPQPRRETPGALYR